MLLRSAAVALYVGAANFPLAVADIGCPPDCDEDGRPRPPAHWGGSRADLNDMQKLGGAEPESPPLELTPGTWDAKTKGKSVFVKFFAPWCGACKSVKPAWDKLMSDFEDDPVAGIFDVDCINLGQSLCNDLGVNSYPTFRYGDPSHKGKNLDEYRGPRDYESMKRFAEENLVPQCTPWSLDACTSSERKALEFYMAKSQSYLQSETERLDAEFNQREEATNEKRHAFADRVKKFNEAMDAAEKAEDKEEQDRLLGQEEELNNMAMEIRKEMEGLQKARKDSGYVLMKAALKDKRGEGKRGKKKAKSTEGKQKTAKGKQKNAAQELKSAKLSELKRRALEAGVSSEEVDAVDDADDPKAAAIELVTSAMGGKPELDSVRKELQALSLSKLKKRARQEGIEADIIDAFDDDDDPKLAAINTILDSLGQGTSARKKTAAQTEL